MTAIIDDFILEVWILDHLDECGDPVGDVPSLDEGTVSIVTFRRALDFRPREHALDIALESGTDLEEPRRVDLVVFLRFDDRQECVGKEDPHVLTSSPSLRG